MEANSYTELKAEEHRTTHGDRKVDTRRDDHLRVGGDQHVKVGSAQLVEAGREIHLKAGQKLVIEAGAELTLKAGGSWIKLDPGGVSLNGPTVRINSGGTPDSGSGITILLPATPWAADQDQAGDLLEPGLTQQRFDEQLRLVTSLGLPVSEARVAIRLPSAAAPLNYSSDGDGRYPRLHTDAAENAQVHLIWDELLVPENSDDYLASRNQ
ncbi:hypothetical protein D9M69_486800 [compost metagenome]